MANNSNAEGGCQFIGEYVDAADLSSKPALGRGEVVRPKIVADYLENWGQDQSFKEFTILLKDGRVVAVRGHGLKHMPANGAVEIDCFGIYVRSGDQETIVGLFKSLEVVGIFHGELRPDRKIA
jgi:hypothetical protein